MVMPELSHQNEQFYPHGLKSLSKGMTFFRTDSRLFHCMHTNPAMRGGKSALSLLLYHPSHAQKTTCIKPAAKQSEGMPCCRAQSRWHNGEDTAAPGAGGHHSTPWAIQICGAPDSDVPPGW